MKERLLDWVNGQRQLAPTAKFLLYKLAQFADGECCAWATIQVLADAVNISERSVQYKLREFERDGLISKSGRMHRMRNSTRSVPIYQLAPDVEGLGSPAAGGGCMGADFAPMDRHGCKPGGGMGAKGLHPQEPMGTEFGRSNDLPLGAREAEPQEPGDHCAQAWAGFPEAGRKGVSSLRQARVAWRAELEAGADPAQLLAAVRAYAGDRKSWGTSGRPCAFHRFLAEGRYVEFGELATGPGCAEPPPRPLDLVAPPEDLRAAVVAATDEAKARSYFDPCGWREADRALVARTAFAADWLRRNVSCELRAHAATVQGPPAQLSSSIVGGGAMPSAAVGQGPGAAPRH